MLLQGAVKAKVNWEKPARRLGDGRVETTGTALRASSQRT